MTTRDNAPPHKDWRPEPRTCELCDICETRTQAFWRHNPERDTHPTTYETAGNEPHITRGTE